MPSRRAPKRRAEPSGASRASSTGHRSPKAKGGKRAYREKSHAAASTRKMSLPSLSMPVAAGATALVIAGVGAITVGSATGDGSPGETYPSLSGNLNAAGLDTGARVDGFDPSRDIDREVLEEQAEQQADQRRQALKQLAAQTDKHAKDLKLTQWVLPLAGYRLTATFGQAGEMWGSGFHTGLDFAAASGTPLVAVAHGEITETGDAGAYRRFSPSTTAPKSGTATKRRSTSPSATRSTRASTSARSARPATPADHTCTSRFTPTAPRTGSTPTPCWRTTASSRDGHHNAAHWIVIFADRW